MSEFEVTTDIRQAPGHAHMIDSVHLGSAKRPTFGKHRLMSNRGRFSKLWLCRPGVFLLLKVG
jgi:hypothetical protein